MTPPIIPVRSLVKPRRSAAVAFALEGPRAARYQQRKLDPLKSRRVVLESPHAAPKPKISPGATSPTLVEGLSMHQQRLAHEPYDLLKRQGVGPALVQRKQKGRS